MSKVNQEWVWQKDILEDMWYMSKGRYHPEVIRGCTFRHEGQIFHLYNDFEKKKEGIKTLWRRKMNGEKSYNENKYKKPLRYYQLLTRFDDSKRIFTLGGPSKNCLKILDVDRTIDVGVRYSNPEICKDILNIDFEKDDGINLDFEGFLSDVKVRKLSSCKAGKILLTIQDSFFLKKNLLVLSKTFKITEEHVYTSRERKMFIFWLDRLE